MRDSQIRYAIFTAVAARKIRKKNSNILPASNADETKKATASIAKASAGSAICRVPANSLAIVLYSPPPHGFVRDHKFS
jgi:hypothetical protein